MKTYIMCSGGKDSMATCILAYENKIPIDGVVISEFYFDNERKIPAEHPIQYEWKHKVAIPKLKEMGFNVIVVSPPSDIDYIQLFHRKTKYSKVVDRNGRPKGFPIAKTCWAKSYCKQIPLDKWCRKQGKFQKIIGFAYDEKERIERLKRNGWRSLLYEYKITEKDAYDLSKSYGLLSPIYQYQFRDGCWFCPNSSIKQFAKLQREYPHLWEELRKLSTTPNLICPKFKYDMTFAQVEKQIIEINNQVTMFDLIEEKGEKQ